MFKVHVNRDFCKGCGICIEFCPKKVYVFSEEPSHRGVYCPNPVNESECVGCRLCEIMCPDQAVDIEEVK